MKSQNPEIEMAELHPLKNSIYQQYEDNVKVHTDEISRCEKKAKWFVIGQLAAFILAISCIAIYAMYYGETVVIVLAIFFVLAYITLRRMDVANGDKMERLKAVRSVYANEMAYINGDFKAFRDGKQYINPCHAYSFDMDVFGEQSLFQRINRTVTSGGSDDLAAQLGSASTRTRREIEDQRDAINELADDVSLRTSFIAVGQLRGDIINTDEVKRLKKWFVLNKKCLKYEGECTLIEVKASSGNVKSTKTILAHPEKYHVHRAIKLCDVNIGQSGQMTILPLYMAFLLDKP